MAITTRDGGLQTAGGERLSLQEYGFVPDPDRGYTADEVRALNAANPRHWPRFECVAGRLLVTPAPTYPHQTVAQRLLVALLAYCDVHFADGVPVMPPADVSWGGRDTTVQPDVFVVPRPMAQTAWQDGLRGRGGGWRAIRHLLLAAEVLSPSTAADDRGDKRRLYQRRRVPLYWIVDVEARAVEAWTPGGAEPRVERERLVWHPEGAAVPFELALAELFRPV